MSQLVVARELGVTADGLRLIAKRIPALKEALGWGKDLSQAWWEEQGRIALNDRTFQTALYQIHMRNRFGWSSVDRVEHKVGGTIKHEGKVVLSLTPAELGVT